MRPKSAGGDIMRIAIIVASLVILAILQGCASAKVGLRPFPDEIELEPFAQRWASAKHDDQTEQAKDLDAYRVAAVEASKASLALTQAEAKRDAASYALQSAATDQAAIRKDELATAESETALSRADALLADRTLKSNYDAVDPERRVKLLRRTVAAYATDVYRRAKERSVMAWEANEMATFGGMGAVLGGIASKTGLINTGAAVAAIGLTNSQFYKLETQRQSYITALKRLTCISAKMALITQQDLDRASQSTNIGAGATAAMNFESTIVYQVDAVRMDYINALLGIAPTELDRATLETISAKYKSPDNPGAASTVMAQGVKGAAPPDTAAFDAAATKVKEASDAVLLCTKT